MKYTFLIFSLLMFSIMGNSANIYYFSSSYNESANGKSDGTIGKPFTRMTTFDSLLLNKWPGVTLGGDDQILFKKGESFQMTRAVRPTAHGTKGHPITIGAYGTSGNKPYIYSFKKLTSWVSTKRANVYTTKDAIGTESQYMPMLLLNSVLKPVGRWPNDTAASYGYKFYDNTNGSTQFSDSKYTTYTDRPKDDTGAYMTNISDGEIVVRANHYRINKLAGWGSSNIYLTGTKLVFDSKNGDNYIFKDGFGYFLQNHINYLDMQGEWSYDANTDKVSIYLTSSPSNFTIEVPIADNFVSLTGESNYVFDGIDAEGFNYSCIEGGGSTDSVTIKNNKIAYSGYAGVYLKSGNPTSSTWNINNNEITNCLTYGVRSYANELTVTDNVITKIMPISGMNTTGGSGMGAGVVTESGDNQTITYNKISQTGYSGINFNRGANVLVAYNFLDSCTQRIDDGGVIYTVNLVHEYFDRNKVVKQNILAHNSLPISQAGCGKGGKLTMALYGDQRSDHIKWDGNIILDGRVGWYVNSGSYDTVTNNIIFQNTSIGLNYNLAHPEDEPDARNNYIHDNVVYNTSTDASKASTPKGIFISGHDTVVTGTDKGYPIVSGWGNFDHNYYIWPFMQSSPKICDAQAGVTSSIYINKWMTTANFNTHYGYEGTSKTYNKALPSGATASNAGIIIYNDKKYDSIVNLGGKAYYDFKDDTTYSENSVKLAPFTGKILVWVGSSSTTNSAPSTNITSPTSNSSFTAPASIDLIANATDPDGNGTIQKVEFFNGTTSLGTGTLIANTTTYKYTWTGVASGTYTITSKVTDNGGKVVTSVSVSITVGTSASNTAPTLSITTPVANTVYLVGDTISWLTPATDADGSVAQVDYYINDSIWHTEKITPYTWDWIGAKAGTYSIKAKATDDKGATTTTTAFTITVSTPTSNPTVTVKTPIDGTVIDLGSVVNLSVNTKTANTISKVEFYYDADILIGSSTTGTSGVYTVPWKPTAGSHTWYAKATDSKGLVGTSSTTGIYVLAPVQPITGDKYYTQGIKFYKK